MAAWETPGTLSWKAVIFDLDGVIVDSEPVYLENLWAYVRGYRPEVTLEQMYDTVGRSAADCWERVRTLMDDARPWEDIRRDYRSTTRKELVLDYARIFRPQAALVLPELKARGLKLALASSSGLDLVHQVLKETGIHSWFDAVVSGDMFRESKPNPEIYHFTAASLGVPEPQCLAVEDSTVGILAAKGAGMSVAALADLRFPFEQWRADYLIQDIRELLALTMEKQA